MFSLQQKMADANIVIPFVFHFAAGVYGPHGKHFLLPLPHQFEIARRKGWSDDPDDPGGATMIDVTLATYSAYRKNNGLTKPDKGDLQNITFPEWKDILITMFWNRILGNEIQSQGVANIIFDWIWASGPLSVRKLQDILGVTADGIFGPLTLRAVNKSDPAILFGKIRESRIAHYRSCRSAWKYLRGWLRRLDAILPDGTFRI